MVAVLLFIGIYAIFFLICHISAKQDEKQDEINLARAMEEQKKRDEYDEITRKTLVGMYEKKDKVIDKILKEQEVEYTEARQKLLEELVAENDKIQDTLISMHLAKIEREE